MKTLMQDGKKIIMRKLGCFCILLLSVLLLSGLTWGNDIVSLLQGPEKIETFEAEIHGDGLYRSLDHSYTTLDIEMITGSYAQYGEVKESKQSTQTVYYLMPVDNGNYFVTIIAYGDHVAQLDEMEQAFYESIGIESKEYPDPIHVEGGFQRLSEEELKYALDYFQGYDESIQTIDDLPTLLSPYAITINQVGSVAISSLWTIFTIWILLAILLIFCGILYLSNVFLRRLRKDIKALPESLQAKIEEDYPKATAFDSLKIGTHLLYQKEAWTWRVFDYDTFIWIYKKERLGKKKRCFEICAYDKAGTKIQLWLGEDEKKTERILQKIFDHCHDALLGYESFIYEYWEQKPEHLYEKLKELSLIKEKQEAEVKQEKAEQKKAAKAKLHEKRKAKKVQQKEQEKESKKEVEKKPDKETKEDKKKESKKASKKRKTSKKTEETPKQEKQKRTGKKQLEETKQKETKENE